MLYIEGAGRGRPCVVLFVRLFVMGTLRPEGCPVSFVRDGCMRVCEYRSTTIAVIPAYTWSNIMFG